jgi:predicted metalloprotease with PDZ domain
MFDSLSATILDTQSATCASGFNPANFRSGVWMRSQRCITIAAVLLIFSNFTLAQRKKAAADSPAPGPAPTITVAVDASDAQKKIFHSHMTFPATAGDFVLYFPKWIPGEHAPDGPVADTAGLFFTANGQQLPWKRDSLDMFTYHVQVPSGVSTVEATMDYLSPVEMPGGYTSGSSATSEMAVVSWNQLLLYPKGWGSDQIQVKPSLKIPQGWQYGTALPLLGKEIGGSGGPPAGNTIEFAQASLTTVVDSPVIMGAHFKAVPLQAGKMPPHELNVAADSEAALTLTPEQTQGFDNLVAEAGALYGARHYRDYHFLLSLSDHVAHFGLEHHESNDSRLGEKYFIDPGAWKLGGSLLPHEYTHSWNGKYRRPFDLATPEYQTPMQTEMLWVYEGLTEYFGFVLAARSGLETPQDWRDEYAEIAMDYSYRAGRQWRPLEDTATAAQVLQQANDGFTNWRRSVDYYDEGALIWLEADTIIRQKTENQKSMDNFAHLFHGQPDGGPTVKTYTFEDVVATLERVTPFDWRTFLADRIKKVAVKAPLAGFENGGWRLVYTDRPSARMSTSMSIHRYVDCTASLGLTVSTENGGVIDTVHGGLADKGGIGPGMRIVAVNGRKYSGSRLTDALKAAVNDKAPIQLLVENTEYYKTVTLDYHDGPRYPHLIRDSSKRDVLGDIIKPKVTTLPKAKIEADVDED